MPMTHSYTSLSTFDTCPRQFEARYITKEVKFQESEATRWGNEVHSALEHYLTARSPIPANIPYQRYADWVLARVRGDELLIENEFAMTRDMQPCGWWDHDAWLRSKIDVVILRPRERIAEVFDWKTGKPKLDRKQLLLYALLVMSRYPDIDEVKTGFVWLANGEVTPPVGYLRMNRDALVVHFRNLTAQVDSADSLGVFTPKPSGLCRQWCQVTSCEFHGKGRR